MKVRKLFSIKDKTVRLIEEISQQESDTNSATVDKAVEFYAKEKYKLL